MRPRATAVSRNLAAFHLDRMAEAGLLTVEYRRLSGRGGRGAGRPRQALPRRRQARGGLAAGDALRPGRPHPRHIPRGARGRRAPEVAARRVARRVGAELGDKLRRLVNGGGDRTLAKAAVEELGYEPVATADRIELRNCPFDELVGLHQG